MPFFLVWLKLIATSDCYCYLSISSLAVVCALVSHFVHSSGGNDDDDAMGGSMGLLSFKPLPSGNGGPKAEGSLLNFNTEVL